MTSQKPTGTVDFYPEDMEIRSKIFALLRATCERFGFKNIESPAFENIDLLTKKSGEEVSKQIFTLEKRGKERQSLSDLSSKGDEQFGLRFDLTVPFTRMFIQKQKELPKPVKWFGISRMWRYERPQAGRLREFYQLSVELFGSNKPEADAEIINLAIACLRSLKLTSEDFYVRLNNRKLLQGILESFAPKENINDLISLVDKKDKIEDSEFNKGLEEFKVKNHEKLKKILETDNIKELEKLELNEQAKQGLEELKQILPLLNSKFIKLDLTTARGLAYYTGTVFEVFDKKGKFRSIAGGGRYDDMVGLFGGESTPATGFAMGYSTLSLLLKDKNLLPKTEQAIDYYVIIIGENKIKEKALSIISKLRNKYSVDYNLSGRSVKKQMDYANKINAKNVIFIGEKEIWTNKLSVKDMKTGKEKTVEIKDIP